MICFKLLNAYIYLQQPIGANVLKFAVDNYEGFMVGANVLSRRWLTCSQMQVYLLKREKKKKQLLPRTVTTNSVSAMFIMLLSEINDGS